MVLLKRCEGIAKEHMSSSPDEQLIVNPDIPAMRWFDEWDLEGLDENARNRVKGGLCAAHACFLTGDAVDGAYEAMRTVFSAVASAFYSRGLLTTELLTNGIPAIVSDAAISGGWWSPEPTQNGTVRLGNYWVSDYWAEKILRPVLEPSVRRWQSKLLGYDVPVRDRVQEETTTVLTSSQAVGPLAPAAQPEQQSHSRNVQHPVGPRRTPDLEVSRERLTLVDKLAQELAIVKREVKRYSTVDVLKRKHPTFTLWNHIDDSQIKALVDGEEFTPKAYAESLTLTKYGLTSRETLKKDRRKLRKAERTGKQ